MNSRKASEGQTIDAYIITTFDEHQDYQEDDLEGRLQFISGFTGSFAYAVVIIKRKMKIR